MEDVPLPDDLMEETIRQAEEMDARYQELTKQLKRGNEPVIEKIATPTKILRYEQISKIFMTNLLSLMREVHREKGNLWLSFKRRVRGFGEEIVNNAKNAAISVRDFFKKLNFFDYFLTFVALYNKHVRGFVGGVVKVLWCGVETIFGGLWKSLEFVVKSLCDLDSYKNMLNALTVAAKTAKDACSLVWNIWKDFLSIAEDESLVGKILSTIGFGGKFLVELWDVIFDVITDQVRSFVDLPKDTKTEVGIDNIIQSRDLMFSVFGGEYNERVTTTHAGITPGSYTAAMTAKIKRVDELIGEKSREMFRSSLYDVNSDTLNRTVSSFIYELRRTRRVSEREPEDEVVTTSEFYVTDKRNRERFAYEEALVTNIPAFKLDEEAFDTDVMRPLFYIRNDFHKRISSVEGLFYTGLEYALASKEEKPNVFSRYFEKQVESVTGLTFENLREKRHEIDWSEKPIEKKKLSQDEKIRIVQNEVRDTVVMRNAKDALNAQEKELSNNIKDEFLKIISKIRKSFVNVQVEISEPVHST